MKRILVIFCSLVLVSIITFNVVKKYNDARDDYTIKDTNMLSMMLETAIGSNEYVEASGNEWPNEEYTFNSELSACENGSKLSWNSNTKRVVVNGNISDKCYVYFDKTKKTLASYIKNLYTGTQGKNNLYLHDSTLENGAGDNSYRYAGSSETTNNFVCFGYDSTDGTCPTDYLYRIIGVFGDNVKLIKYDYAKSTLLGTTGDYKTTYKSSGGWGTSKGTNTQDEIGGYYWNYNGTSKTGDYQYGSNTWSTSLLNKTNLNSDFINNIGTSWASKIATTAWKVGGNTWENIAQQMVSNAYKNEITTPATNTTVNAKVGLMYVSDFGYAAAPSTWRNSLNSTIIGNGTEGNWMYMGLHECALTPQTSNTYYVFYVASTGNVYSSDAHNGFAVRPVLALESSITYAGGSGTMSEPYLIS